METKSDKPSKVWKATSIVLIITILFLLFTTIITKTQIDKENDLYKTLLIVDSKSAPIYIIEQKANDYYNEASYYYEKNNFNLVESNCRLARGYFAEASQSYNELASYLKNSNIDDELIDIKIQSYNLLSETKLNLYGACEHLESASRYYDTYYNTNVPYDDSSYDMGGNEIDAMNEKIRLHDENVRKYNNLLSDFEVKLKLRLEE